MKKGIIITLAVVALIAGVALIAKPTSLEDRISTTANNQDTAPSARVVGEEPLGPVQSEVAGSGFSLGVPDFEADLFGGGKVKLSELASDKPTLVGFWATWCPNCQRNMPILSNLYQTHRKDVNVIMVNLNESKDDVDDFLSGKGFSFQVAYDEQGVIAAAYGVRFTNTHILIAADGSLIEAFPGDVDESHIDKLLAS